MAWSAGAAVAILVVVVTVATLSCHASPVPLDVPGETKLQIHNDHIIWLHVGTPGKWCRFQARFDVADVYLHQHPSPYSTSWTPLPYTDPYEQPKIRELVVIGNTRVKLPLIVGNVPDTSSITTEGVTSEGVLGLAAGSPLWTLWRNFTKTRDYLYLGYVLPRVGSASENALTVTLPDPLAYATGTGDVRASSFVMQMSGHLLVDSRKNVEAACHRSLLSTDRSAEFAASQELLAGLLALDDNEQRCTVPADGVYTVIIAPEADYNIIPAILTLHPPSEPPVFSMRDSTGGHTRMILFDMYEDVYVEVDPTNGAGTGVKRMANKVGYDDHTIVLGSFGMRRLEIAMLLDDCRAYVTVRHGGLSQLGQIEHSSHSLEVRHVRDIFILVAGIFLWALWAAEPDPVMPKHAEMQPAKFHHSQRNTMDLDSPLPTETAQHTTRTGLSFVVPVSADSNEVILRRAAVSQQQPEDIEAVEHAPVQQQPSSSSSVKADVAEKQETARRLARLSEDTTTRVAAVYQTMYGMEIEWPVRTKTLLYAQALTEALVILYFVMALAFYDTTWVLSLILDSAATTNALGWTTLGFIWLALVLLSIIATLSATSRDPRLGGLCIQAQLLAALSTLMVSLFQWDLALGGLFVITAVLSVVVLMMVAHVTDLLPQDTRHLHSNHTSLRAVTIIFAIGYILYVVLALFPFIIDRLWDHQQLGAFIAAFLLVALVVPLALYMTLLSFMYPFALANAAVKIHLINAQQQHTQITGNP